jgi:Fe-S-cluster containining protein
MPAIRHFKIEIETPDGTLGPAEIAVCDEPLKLADLAPPLHALTDGIVDLAVKRAGQEGRALSCGPGCGVCCCQLVPLTPAEVFFMVERILAMPIAERAEALKRFDANERTIDDAGLTPRIRGLGDTSDNNVVARDYFRLGLFCPFNIHQSCSIHVWRPIACREYNVTSSPSLCADPFTNAITSIGLHRRLSAGLTRFCAHAAGLPAGLVPMPLLFDYYESHREAAQRTWPGIELFKQALDFVLGSAK